MIYLRGTRRVVEWRDLDTQPVQSEEPPLRTGCFDRKFSGRHVDSSSVFRLDDILEGSFLR